MARMETVNPTQESLKKVERIIHGSYGGESYVLKVSFLYTTANFYQQPHRIEGTLECDEEEFNFIIQNQRLEESGLSQRAIDILHYQFAIR